MSDLAKRSGQDLTRGPLVKQILLFSLPLMASNFLQALFNMADIAVVGQFAGPMALGSVGSTSNLMSMFVWFLIGVSSGINVLTATHYGTRDRKTLTETVHSAAILSFLIGVMLLAVGWVLARPLLVLMNTKPELLEGAVLYLRICFLGMPGLALYNFGSAVLNAVGDTRRPLIYLGLAGVLNIVLNVFLVVACHLSVAGVAIATVVSQYASAALVLRALVREGQADYGLRRQDLHLTPGRVRAILGLCIPGGLQTSSYSVANLFVQVGVNSFDAMLVAGNSAATNADFLGYDVMAAFYTACGSFIGQNLGAGNRERVRRSYFISLAYSFGTGLVIGVLLWCFGTEFLYLFTDDPLVVEMGLKRLSIMSLSYCVSSLMDCTLAANRGMGKSLMPTIFMYVGICGFRILWIYTIFAHFHTIPSLYYLYICSWSITGAMEIAYFIRTYRRWSRSLS